MNIPYMAVRGRAFACVTPLMLAALLLPALPASADTAPMREIGSVSVTRGAALERSDESTTVLTRAQIEAAPQTRLDQLLNRIPGVYTPMVPASQLHPTSQIISIRGFGSAFGVKTLVLLDGVPINDGYFRTIDWARIPKTSIERIEVIRGGGATSLWGNLALGGVINIVSRSPQKLERTFDVSYGGYNTWNENLSATLASGKVWRVRGDVSAASANGYNQTPSIYRNTFSSSAASHSSNATLSAYYEPSARTRMTARIEAHDARQSGLTWSSTSNGWMHNGIRIGGSTDISAKAKLNAYAWYDNGIFSTNNASTPGYSLATPNAGSQFLSQRENLGFQTTGGSAYYSNGSFIAGTDYRSIDSVDNNRFLNAGGATTATFVSRGGHRFQGLFAQGTYRLPKMPLEVTLGLRQDFWQTQNGSITGTSAGGVLSNPLANQRYTRFDPRLGLRYRVAEGVHVRAVAYRNFSAPGMNQMYRSFVSGSTYNNSSPNLQPETNAGYEAGFDIERKQYGLHVTAFDNSLKNYIDFPTTCSTTTTTPTACDAQTAGTGLTGITVVRQYLNVGNARIKGLEFLADKHLSSKVTVNAGFTRTIATITSSLFPTVDPVGNQLGGVAPYGFVAGVQWIPDTKLSVNAQVKQFPGYWYNTAHTVYNDTAVVADVGASYKLRDGLQVYATAENAFNSVYNDQGANGANSAPQLGAPFNVTLGLRGSF